MEFAVAVIVLAVGLMLERGDRLAPRAIRFRSRDR